MTDSVLGIDIGKQKFEVHLLVNGKTKSKSIKNNKDGFEVLAQWLNKHGGGLVHACMEATGSYGDELAVDDKKFFLAHGDLIAGGMGHAAWRQSLRSGILRILMTSVGPWITWKIAMGLSKKSRQYSEKKDVEEKLREFARRRIASGSEAVVLGHSHVGGVHSEKADGKKGTYANPGSWAGAKSYLLYEKGVFKLKRWKG